MMNQPIRWGILGTGKIAGEFAQGLQQLADAELVAVGSRTRDGAERFAKMYRVAHAYDSYNALVRDEEVDVIYIATPHVMHKTHCLLALEAGKAVLCEKPFAMNAAEAVEVIALAREKSLFCMEAMWMRFLPAVRETHRLVQEKVIGDIYMIQASLGFLMEYDPTHRVFNLELGGGALLDLGVYPLSLIVQHLGVPDSITSHAHIGATGVDEQAAVILGYADGRMGVLHTGLRTYSANDALFMGSAGAIHLQPPLYRPERLTVQKHGLTASATSQNGATDADTMIAKLRQIEPLRKVYRRAKPWLAPLLGLQERSHSFPVAGNGYQYEAAEVMACLRRGATESAIMPLAETLQIMETMDTIRAQWNLWYPQEAVVQQ